MIEPVVLLAAWPHIRGMSPTLIMIGLTCSGTAGGILFHKLVEKPLMLNVWRAVTRAGEAAACVNAGSINVAEDKLSASISNPVGRCVPDIARVKSNVVPRPR